jgi:hypothetical protein
MWKRKKINTFFPHKLYLWGSVADVYIRITKINSSMNTLVTFIYCKTPVQDKCVVYIRAVYYT